MYAIVETGGKQYRVEEGDVLTIEKLVAEEGETVSLGRVLLIGGNGAPTIGAPIVEGASVSATIIEHGRDKKKIVFRYKNKNRYKVKKGHRQPHTRVRIDSISMDGVVVREEPVYEEEVVAETPVTTELAVVEPEVTELAVVEPVAADLAVADEPVAVQPDETEEAGV